MRFYTDVAFSLGYWGVGFAIRLQPFDAHVYIGRLVIGIESPPDDDEQEQS